MDNIGMLMNLKKLKEPFNPADINWRVGATNLDKNGNIKWGNKAQGIALAYLDSRNVQARLDEACGNLWQVDYPWSDGKKLYCRIGIYSSALKDYVWRGNGAGETQVEGEKGAFSDAFKRAAVMWGVGEYLYHLPNSWFEIDPRKRNFSKETTLEITNRFSKWQQQFMEAN